MSLSPGNHTINGFYYEESGSTYTLSELSAFTTFGLVGGKSYDLITASSNGRKLIGSMP